MDNRPAFAEDFLSLKDEIAGEVAADVSKVIQVVGSQRPKATAKPEQPLREVLPERPKATRVRDSAATPVIVNFTTRIARETLDQLGEAALRQQLKRLSPSTRQSIVQEAVSDWLRRHGYAKGRGSEKVGDGPTD